MTGLIIALIVTVLAYAGTVIFLTLRHYEEKRELYDRLQAKSFEEFKYFKDTFPIENEHNKKVLEDAREKLNKPVSAEEAALRAKAKGF